MKKILAVAAFFLLFASPIQADADNLKSGLDHCAAISDSLKRLTCFDALAAGDGTGVGDSDYKPPLGLSSSLKKIFKETKWGEWDINCKNKPSPAIETCSLTFSLILNDPVVKKHYGLMNLIMAKNNLGVKLFSVSFGDYPGKKTIIRVDDNPSISFETLKINDDKANLLIKEMLKGEKITVKYYKSPHENPLLAEFAIKDFAKKYETFMGLIREVKPGDVVIAKFDGSGKMNTRPFIAPGPWEIKWNASGWISIYLMDATGEVIESAARQNGPGSGSSYFAKPGKYSLKINSIGEWSVQVVSAP